MAELPFADGGAFPEISPQSLLIRENVLFPEQLSFEDGFWGPFELE